MTLHVNIGDAKAKLSKLIAAAVRGEEIVIDKDGTPQVRLEPVAGIRADSRAELVRSRRSALGMYRDRVASADIDIRALKTSDAEREENERRKFGPPA